MPIVNPTSVRKPLVFFAQGHSAPVRVILILLVVMCCRSAPAQPRYSSAIAQPSAIQFGVPHHVRSGERQTLAQQSHTPIRVADLSGVTIQPVVAPPDPRGTPVRLPDVQTAKQSTNPDHPTPAERYFSHTILDNLPDYPNTDQPNRPPASLRDQLDLHVPTNLPPLTEAIYNQAIDAINTAPEILENLPLFGEDYLAFAPFLIPSAQPRTQLRLGYGRYFQATPHPVNGPYSAGTAADPAFNSVSVYSETASGKNAGFVQLDVDNIGLREMTTGAKTSLLEGDGLFSLPTFLPHDRFWVSMLAGTIIPLRSDESFFETSMPAISTGLLTQYQPSTNVMFHGTTTLNFQPGGDSVVLYGFGISSLLQSTQLDDPSGISRALLPTFEALWSTDIGGPRSTEPRGKKIDTILLLAPGLRFILSPEVELGATGAWHVMGSDERSIRLELRYFR